jgi:hypothetical protein
LQNAAASFQSSENWRFSVKNSRSYYPYYSHQINIFRSSHSYGIQVDCNSGLRASRISSGGECHGLGHQWANGPESLVGQWAGWEGSNWLQIKERRNGRRKDRTEPDSLHLQPLFLCPETFPMNPRCSC